MKYNKMIAVFLSVVISVSLCVPASAANTNHVDLDADVRNMENRGSTFFENEMGTLLSVTTIDEYTMVKSLQGKMTYSLLSLDILQVKSMTLKTSISEKRLRSELN